MAFSGRPGASYRQRQNSHLIASADSVHIQWHSTEHDEIVMGSTQCSPFSAIANMKKRGF